MKVGSRTKTAILDHISASLRRLRATISAWMRRTSATWFSSTRTSVEGRPVGLTVWGSLGRSGVTVRARDAGRPPGGGASSASSSSPLTSSSRADRWNGSMPALRSRRTASKSEVAGRPCFCASRRAMRNWRPVSPSCRMAFEILAEGGAASAVGYSVAPVLAGSASCRLAQKALAAKAVIILGRHEGVIRDQLLRGCFDRPRPRWLGPRGQAGGCESG